MATNPAPKNMSDEKKELLFSELHSLLSSGLDFSRSFNLLIDSERDPKTIALLRALLGEVVKGALFCESMRLSGKFSALDCGIIRIGEETGRLSESLIFLSSYYKKKNDQRKMIASAVRYPLIILSVAIVVLIFMMVVVIPMFEEVYMRMGGQLPAITKHIIRFSKSFPFWAIFTGASTAAVGTVIYYFRNNRKVRAGVAGLLLSIPIVGSIVKKNNQARLCKLLYLLACSGVPLMSAIRMLMPIITFFPYNNSLAHCADHLMRGGQLSSALEKFPGLYDKKLIALVRVGEETNSLPDMFGKQAEELSGEVEYFAQKLGTTIEPVLVLLVGILVATILVSMYMPMFKLGNVMG